MKLKRFVAADMRSALAKIKEDLTNKIKANITNDKLVSINM